LVDNFNVSGVYVFGGYPLLSTGLTIIPTITHDNPIFSILFAEEKSFPHSCGKEARTTVVKKYHPFKGVVFLAGMLPVYPKRKPDTVVAYCGANFKVSQATNSATLARTDKTNTAVRRSWLV
jgi:hypothetical protein